MKNYCGGCCSECDIDDKRCPNIGCCSECDIDEKRCPNIGLIKDKVKPYNNLNHKFNMQTLDSITFLETNAYLKRYKWQT